MLLLGTLTDCSDLTIYEILAVFPYFSHVLNDLSGLSVDLQEEFKKVADQVKNMKTKPTDDEILILYSLYKQAMVGDVNIGMRLSLCELNKHFLQCFSFVWASFRQTGAN